MKKPQNTQIEKKPTISYIPSQNCRHFLHLKTKNIKATFPIENTVDFLHLKLKMLNMETRAFLRHFCSVFRTNRVEVLLQEQRKI